MKIPIYNRAIRSFACATLSIGALAFTAPAWPQGGLAAPILKYVSAPAAVSRETSEDTELLLAGDSVVTTVTKMAQRIGDSPAAVTVITEDDIRNSGATSIPALLRSVPGVDVEEPNASQENVSIRGFNQLFANKLLVMVDGRSIYQDVYGNVYWNTEPLLLSRIKRIEIVRGPGSVLYGANAFDGVINIITKTPEEMAAGEQKTTYIAAHGEQNSNFYETTTSAGKAGDWAATLGLGYHSTDGFMPAKPNGPRDSSRVPILSLDLQKHLSRGSLSLSTAYSDARSDLLSELYVPDGEFHTSDAMLSYIEDRGDNPITARIYGNFFRLAGSDIYVATTSYNAELQQQRRISASSTLVYGASYRESGFIASPSGQQRRSQSLYGLFLQDQLALGPATNLFAGVRWDHNSIYGSELSPRVSLVHHLPKDQSVRVSYGTAFRAPTDLEAYLNESVQVAPGVNDQLIGNTSLKPEKIASMEVGYRRDLRGGYVGASVFNNYISDLILAKTIQYASAPFPPGIPIVSQYVNGDKAQATGLELEGGFTITRSLHGLLNYSYQNVFGSDGDGGPIDLSPHNKINLVLNDAWKQRWTAYAAIHYVSASTFLNDDVAYKIPAYTTLDARVGYRVGTAECPWTLALSAINLFNDRHRELPDVLTSISDLSQSAPIRRTGWVSLEGKF